jgi:membrane-associated phospholipid phosphatase
MRSRFAAHIAAALLTLSGSALADTTHDFAKFLSNGGTVAFLVAGAALPLARDGRDSKEHTLRAMDGIGTATLASELTKMVVHERRPNNADLESFPSGHATAAFAAATMESAFHPKEAPLWYAGATLIGWSRVDLREHHTYDVVAGALLGYGIARLELSQKHGLILSPWIGHETRSAGLSLNGTF